MFINQESSELYIGYTGPNPYDEAQYVEVAGCIFHHICIASNLSSIEKIYYLLLDCEAIINLKRGGNRATASTAKIWAKRLSCSKSQIFTMQKSLEKKQYLHIKRSTNANNQNNRNLLSTSLPKSVFERLVDDHSTDRLIKKNTDDGNSDVVDYRAYLDQTKILVKVDFALFRKIIASQQISYIAKLFCIDCYSPCYLPNIRGDDKGLYQSTFTYSSIMERYNITRVRLSSILVKLDRINWIHKHRVGKFKNPPIWNVYWYIKNIKNAVSAKAG
jgi:hypothetical protein